MLFRITEVRSCENTHVSDETVLAAHGSGLASPAALNKIMTQHSPRPSSPIYFLLPI